MLGAVGWGQWSGGVSELGVSGLGEVSWGGGLGAVGWQQWAWGNGLGQWAGVAVVWGSYLGAMVWG